jgi:hypothetical protein
VHCEFPNGPSSCNRELEARIDFHNEGEAGVKYITAAAIGLALFGGTSAASAYSFSPSNANFRLNGKVSITTGGQAGQGKCESRWVGKLRDLGEHQIVSFSLGGSHSACRLGFQIIRFKLTVTGPDTASMANVIWEYPNFTGCGPSTLPVTINSSGIWSFSGPIGPCTISGALTSTPPVTITP